MKCQHCNCTYQPSLISGFCVVLILCMCTFVCLRFQFPDPPADVSSRRSCGFGPGGRSRPYSYLRRVWSLRQCTPGHTGKACWVMDLFAWSEIICDKHVCSMLECCTECNMNLQKIMGHGNFAFYIPFSLIRTNKVGLFIWRQLLKANSAYKQILWACL